MTYYIVAEKISLVELRERIEETDLVPSRVSLLDEINSRFKALELEGITSLAELRKELKNAKRLETLSSKTGIESKYLILLRREIESYFPKPIALKKFDWLQQSEISKLNQFGFRSAVDLFEVTNNSENLTELSRTTGVGIVFLETFVKLVELTRIQWISPKAARMLVEAGYDNTEKVATADAEKMCEALNRINDGNKYFKGKFGLRDIQRLIRSAGYVLKEVATY